MFYVFRVGSSVKYINFLFFYENHKIIEINQNHEKQKVYIFRVVLCFFVKHLNKYTAQSSETISFNTLVKGRKAKHISIPKEYVEKIGKQPIHVTIQIFEELKKE